MVCKVEVAYWGIGGNDYIYIYIWIMIPRSLLTTREAVLKCMCMDQPASGGSTCNLQDRSIRAPRGRVAFCAQRTNLPRQAEPYSERAPQRLC